MRMVWSSGASYLATWSWPLRLRTATFGFISVSSVKITSAAVKGWPSCQVTPGRSLMVQVRPSALMPPFCWVGISVARLGRKLPFGSSCQSESNTVNSTAVSTPVLT